MAKYSFELKKKIVLEYLAGDGGLKYLSKKYGLKSETQLRNWLMVYKGFGEEGLIRSRKKNSYSFDFKLRVVELYLSSELSYRELALKEGISNPSMITDWIIRFRAVGPEGLRPHRKGRKSVMGKPKKATTTQPLEEPIVDTSAEHIRELEDELLKLRIENAFLKELRRLRLEDEAKMRERRASSRVSEESSS